MKTLLLLIIVLIQLFYLIPAQADTVKIPMQAVQADGRPIEKVLIHTEKGDQKAWVITGRDFITSFLPTTPVSNPTNSTLYLEVIYLDDCYGHIKITYNGKEGEYSSPDRVYLGNAVKTGQIVTAMFRLSGLIPEGPNGQPVVHIGLERAKGASLSVLNVSIQNEPFDNPQFKYIIASPWRGPYTGLTVKPADNTTLKGKIMVGYQGWFRTPNDPEGRGWVHWGDMQNGIFNTDMWPDLTQYPEQVLEKAADIKLKSGKAAYLFSSAWPEVTNLHFRWMREHDIDGAFFQRFVSDRFCSISGGTEYVLANVRTAANNEGRIWAVEYDVSGYPDAKLLKTLRKDWKWLIDTFKIGNDPNYARENGKLVVFIWGMPFPDRNITLATSNAVVDFFKNDPQYGGNYVIGGIPNNWRIMDAGWQEHFKHYDAISPWMSTAYASDMADFAKMGVTYYPHAKPGFSWSNLKHIPTGSNEAYTPREGGRFYWKLLSEAAKAKVDRMFIGMFDEYDEGTAIMPMSDDVPQPLPNVTWGRFINNEDKSSDWYLRITRYGKEMILGKRPADSLMPEK